MKKFTNNKELGIIIVLAMLSAFAPFATDMYLPGFPAIANDLATYQSSVQLSLSVFFLGMALGQLLYSPFTEIFGRKSTLLVGITLFTLCSFLIIKCSQLNELVFLRAWQAIGGCSGLVISRIIIQDLFTKNESAQALSLMMVIQGIGPVIAPLTGSLLLSHFHWHSIFYALGLFGLICLIFTKKYIPETKDRNEKNIITLSGFLKYYYDLLINRIFLINCLIGSFAVAILFTFIATSPNLLMNSYNLNEKQYGIAFGLIAFGIMIFSQINRMVLKKHSIEFILRIATYIGLIMSIIVMIALFYHSLVLLILSLFLCIGMVPIIAANSTAIAMSSKGINVSVASSMIGVSQFGLGFIFSSIPGLFISKNNEIMSIIIIFCFVLITYLIRKNNLIK